MSIWKGGFADKVLFVNLKSSESSVDDLKQLWSTVSLGFFKWGEFNLILYIFLALEGVSIHHFRIFVYLRDGDKYKHAHRVSSSAGLLPQRLQQKACSKREARNSIQVPTWWQGSNCLSHHLLSLRIGISRKLLSGT